MVLTGTGSEATTRLAAVWFRDIASKIITKIQLIVSGRTERRVTPRSALPIIAAHSLERRRVPFDDPDWLFEIKADGFRGLLYIVEGDGLFVSRNGRELRRSRPLAEALARKLKVKSLPADVCNRFQSRSS